MKYQPIVVTIPDNIIKPFVLNERFRSSHQKKQFFVNKSIHIILRSVTRNYTVQINRRK
ncbi:hypothetical protein [Candidatus Enterovibrio altilux]|uniref:hypothetical protein n=1 Tax=Candidatus Enterovibrio altilux TaxID=1927128 RepID=UPI003744960E